MKNDEKVVSLGDYKNNVANETANPEQIQIKTVAEHYEGIKANILDIGDEIVCRDIIEFMVVSKMLMDNDPNIRYVSREEIFVNNNTLIRVIPRYRDEVPGVRYVHANLVNDYSKENKEFQIVTIPIQ